MTAVKLRGWAYIYIHYSRVARTLITSRNYVRIVPACTAQHTAPSYPVWNSPEARVYLRSLQPALHDRLLRRQPGRLLQILHRLQTDNIITNMINIDISMTNINITNINITNINININTNINITNIISARYQHHTPTAKQPPTPFPTTVPTPTSIPTTPVPTSKQRGQGQDQHKYRHQHRRHQCQHHQYQYQ